jgi:hypothetical protein
VDDGAPEPAVGASVVAAHADLARWGGGAGVGWLGEYERMALAVARSVTLPKAIREAGDVKAQAATVLALALAGRELGIGFMRSTRLIHIIDGQTTLSAELMVSRARLAGHPIVAVEHTPRRCVVTCEACELPPAQRVEWALEPADASSGASWPVTIASEIMISSWGEKRGERVTKSLTDKDNYRNYSAEMLFWRASVALIRRHCSEATGGMYAAEELGGDGEE